MQRVAGCLSMSTFVIGGFWALLRERLGLQPYVMFIGVAASLALLLMTPRTMRTFRARYPDEVAGAYSFVTNLHYLYLSGVTEIIARTFTTCALALVALRVGLRVEPSLLSGFGPVSDQPRWLIVIEMLVVNDFLFYWTHRMAHAVPLLWKLHAVHHSTEHMSFTAAARVHPLESYAVVFHMLPLFALGFPVDALLELGPINIGYAMLIHSNLQFKPGRWGYLLNSPAYHRWHHARKYRGNGTNYAGYFPIFDVLFGTYDFPEGAPDDIGIDDVSMPKTYLGQLVYPFVTAPRRQATDVSSRAPLATLVDSSESTGSTLLGE